MFLVWIVCWGLGWVFVACCFGICVVDDGMLLNLGFGLLEGCGVLGLWFGFIRDFAVFGLVVCYFELF